MKEIAISLIAEYSSGKIPSLTAVEINFIASIFKAIPQLMFSENFFFIQLIAHMTAPDSEVRTLVQADELYKRYLDDERIQPYTKKIEFDIPEDRKIDWGDDQSVIFALCSSPKNTYMMLLSRDVLNGLLSSDSLKNSEALDKFSLYRQTTPDPEIQPTQSININELFGQHFTVFYASYVHSLEGLHFSKFLSMLKLEKELYNLLDSALLVREMNEKLINSEQEERLHASFAPFMTNVASKPGLTPQYRDAILKIFLPSSASNKEKAGVLMCLSAVFVKYSSSAMFGTESESPYPIRNFGYALMAEANSFASNEFKGVFADWENRLLGVKRGVFSCTAVLFGDMHGLLKRHFPSTVMSIIPPVWS